MVRDLTIAFLLSGVQLTAFAADSDTTLELLCDSSRSDAIYSGGTVKLNVDLKNGVVAATWPGTGTPIAATTDRHTDATAPKVAIDDAAIKWRLTDSRDRPYFDGNMSRETGQVHFEAHSGAPGDNVFFMGNCRRASKKF